MSSPSTGVTMFSVRPTTFDSRSCISSPASAGVVLQAGAGERGDDGGAGDVGRGGAQLLDERQRRCRRGCRRLTATLSALLRYSSVSSSRIRHGACASSSSASCVVDEPSSVAVLVGDAARRRPPRRAGRRAGRAACARSVPSGSSSGEPAASRCRRAPQPARSGVPPVRCTAQLADERRGRDPRRDRGTGGRRRAACGSCRRRTRSAGGTRRPPTRRRDSRRASSPRTARRLRVRYVFSQNETGSR